MNSHSITGNKKATIESDFNVIGRNCFRRQGEPIRKSYHKIPTISKTLSTIARYAMSFGFDCACLSKKLILKLLTYKGVIPRTARQSYWNREGIKGTPSTLLVFTMNGKGGRTLKNLKYN